MYWCYLLCISQRWSSSDQDYGDQFYPNGRCRRDSDNNFLLIHRALVLIKGVSYE